MNLYLWMGKEVNQFDVPFSSAKKNRIAEIIRQLRFQRSAFVFCPHFLVLQVAGIKSSRRCNTATKEQSKDWSRIHDTSREDTLWDNPYSFEKEVGKTMPSLTCKHYVETARRHCKAQSFVTTGHHQVTLNMCECNVLSLFSQDNWKRVHFSISRTHSMQK